MSYLVLARKWRPRQFSEMVGQEHVLRALVNALDNQRLHHAYLFTGTRGVGKTTVARLLAKALNCEQGIVSRPCGECDACREIDEGRFVDLIEVDAASRTKVDDTRELLDNVQYAPTRGRFKVYLIDEVHMLSGHSFNALLKTLEEPPPHVKFLLATTDPQKLPITVLSRCLQFNLKRLSVELIEGRLAHITREESIGAEPPALQLLARAADGSMRDGLSLLDQVIAFGGGEIREAEVAEMLGTIDRKYVVRLLDTLAGADAAALLDEVATMDELVPDYGSVLADMASLLQRIAVEQAVEGAGGGDWSREEVQRLAGLLSPEDVQLYYQVSLLGRNDLFLAPDPRSGFEMTLLRMLTFRPSAPATGEGSDAPPQARVEAQPRRAATASKGQAASATAVTDPVGKKGSADSDWASLIGQLGLRGAVKQLAANCVLVRRDDNMIHLQMDKASESMLTDQLQEKLHAALARHFDAEIGLRIHAGEPERETPAQSRARQQDERAQAARDSLDSDPNVRALQETFGATIQEETVQSLDKPATS